jgi:hypothetical protein
MSRTSKKSPQELATELQNRANRLLQRAALESAGSNPEVARIESVLANVGKMIAANSRKLVGPNSFENRKKSAELRLRWIEAEERLVKSEDAALRANREYLNGELVNIAAKLAKGETIDSALVDGVLLTLSSGTGDDSLLLETEAAEKNWRDFTASLRTVKDDSTVPIIEAQSIETEGA